jgi:hypothetical protein
MFFKMKKARNLADCEPSLSPGLKITALLSRRTKNRRQLRQSRDNH